MEPNAPHLVFSQLPPPPLVGRNVELRKLQDTLSSVVSERQVRAVTMIGAPGIGKTRLLHEFLRRARDSEHRLQVFQSAGREHGPTIGIVQRVLEARFGIHDGMSPDEAKDRFRATVSEVLGDRRVTEFLHFLGLFLNLRFPDSAFIQAVEEEDAQMVQIARIMLRRFFELDAERVPTILAFEDLHWATADALNLIEYLGQSSRDVPILFVCTARPELLSWRPQWCSSPGGVHHTLMLSPLDANASSALAQAMLGDVGQQYPALVRACTDLGGGSPYLIEQVVRSFFSGGTIHRDSGGEVKVDLKRLEHARLPLSVEDAVRARINALSPTEHTLLEMAATTGGIFWLGALVALDRIAKASPSLWGGVGEVADQIQDVLRNLEERDYVLRLPDSMVAGEVEYAFKHNLERETLHRMTNPAQLRNYHKVVAQWLEFRFAERAEEHCEILAQHYEQGGLHHKAAVFYVLAAERAKARYANQKAADFYERGVALIGDDDATLRMDALHGLGDVLQLSGRNQDALAAFTSMLDIAYHLDLKSKGGAAHNRIGRVYRNMGMLDDAMRHLGTGHALFDASGDKRGVASSLDDIGKVHWMRGNHEAGGKFILDALNLRKELGDARSIALSYNNLGLVYQDSGRFEDALQAFNEALQLQRQSNDLPGIAQTLNNLGTLHQDSADDDRAIELWSEALEVAKEVGDRTRQAVIYTNLGESNYRLRRPVRAIQLLRKAEDIAASLGDKVLEAEILRGLASAHLMAEDLVSARRYIERALGLFEEVQSKPFLGIAHRTLAEVLAAECRSLKDGVEVQKAFETSARIFQELGSDLELAKTCEAHANFLMKFGARREAIAELRDRVARLRDPERVTPPSRSAATPHDGTYRQPFRDENTSPDLAPV
jgi:tetratricopeptide (TPR) repeat protein